MFNLTNPLTVNSTPVDCVCVIHGGCRSPVMLVKWRLSPDFNSEIPISLYTIPGLFVGCSLLDSLFYSTLECFSTLR